MQLLRESFHNRHVNASCFFIGGIQLKIKKTYIGKRNGVINTLITLFHGPEFICLIVYA